VHTISFESVENYIILTTRKENVEKT